MKRLANKTALITGGMKGIGYATAEVFLEQGAKVMLVDIDEDQLNAAVSKLDSDRVMMAVADVTDFAAVQQATRATIEQFGGLDVLFCNAGIAGEINPIWEYTEEMFDRVMAVNVKGVWNSIRTAIPHMIKGGGGSIIATSSVAGLIGSPKSFAYSASKHAVVGMIKSAAPELARFKIRINSVHPGPVETDMVRGLEQVISEDQEKGKAFLEKRIPMRRYAAAREVGELALFLASEDSRYITGETHRIDGGFMSY